MPAYLVSTVQITDRERFKAYAQAIAGLAEEHGGEYLVRGPVAEILEGDCPADERIVVLAFPDAAAARAYVESDRYREGKRHREGAGEVNLRLVTP
jgi:uncharacterized protein (DUF1330 family)